MKVNVEFDIKLERIEDLLTCAFEGGSNYWYLIKGHIKPTETTYLSHYDTEPETNYLTPALNPGGGLIIVDREEDIKTAKEFLLNLNTIKKGLRLMSKKYPKHMADFLGENEDADTGDAFLQLCLFGELVYG